MKKLILLSAFVIGGIAVNAQSSARPAPSAQQDVAAADKANKQTAKISEVVTLTDAQKEKVYAINLQKNKDLDVVNANKASTDADRDKIKNDRTNEILALLTPDQKEKYKKMMAEKKAAAK